MKYCEKVSLLILLASLSIASSVGVAILCSELLGSLFGHNIYIVASGSMEPTLLKGNLILIDKNVNVSDIYAAPYPNGTIIVFHQLYGDETIVHRAIEKRTIDDKIYYVTKGDHNISPDPGPIPAENVIGKVVNNNYSFYVICLNCLTLLLVAVATGVSSVVVARLKRGVVHTESQNRIGLHPVACGPTCEGLRDAIEKKRGFRLATG